ncbi:monocarboxylate transporter 9-like isoform X2 [Rhipicephalus microplus]|uniref:monocarboxylate transporter 9-like isoform X2 n=1 Tax=Rhipicephalus microplus TaxID=6941 RepID=UPI003F6B2770
MCCDLRSTMAGRGSTLTATELTRRPVPMDRCWSVPFASALSAFLLVLNSSCYGFLYVLFMKKYGINHAEAAWPASALVIAGSSVCLVVSALQDRLSVFHITLVGGLLASLGLIASTFTPTIAWMTFTFGVLHGFFRDKNGSYDYLYAMLAILCLLHAILLGLLTWRKAICRRQRLDSPFLKEGVSELQDLKKTSMV